MSQLWFFDLARIAKALVVSGYTALDAQAKALGLSRSTAWTIVTAQHKLGRISQKIRARMVTHPGLPPLVRADLEPVEVRRTNERILDTPRKAVYMGGAVGRTL